MEFVNEQIYKDKSGIYKITQISTGITYIGQTKMMFIKRYWHHNWKLNDNSHDNKYLQNAWNKYGENDFKFEVIEVLDKNIDMNEIEKMYIVKYNTFNNGFNLTIGGDGKRCCPMSEEAKKIVGEKNRKHNLGKKHSKDTREKMRLSSPRRKMTPEHRELILSIRTGFKYSDESKEKMRKSHLGSKNQVSVTNEQQVVLIKKMLIAGSKNIEIAKELNIDYSIVRTVLSEKAWSHVLVEGWADFKKEYNKNKKRVLSKEEVCKIRQLLSDNCTANYISEILNIKPNVVYGIKQNRTYKNIT